MNRLEFPETGFRDFPERGGRRGGGIFSRVFPFLAVAVLAGCGLWGLLFPEPASAQSVSLSLNPSSITEEDGAQKITVIATVSSISNPSFCFYLDVGAHSPSQQTATEGIDYVALARKLVSFSGPTTVSTTFDVTAIDDSVSDGGETIRVHSWKASDQSCKYDLINSYGSANLTLNDSDPKANLSVSPTELNEDAGATTVTVTATLNLQGTRTLSNSVTYTGSVGKTGDTATKGTDYTAGSFTVTLPSGTANAQTTGTFTLTPLRDNASESDETITVRGESTNDGDAGEATITLKNSANLCSSQSPATLQADCLVLDALYDSAGGADWSNNTNWKTANSLATWHGVKVRDGRVYEIELYDNGLTGTISDLSALTGLTYLDLGNDDPRGTGATNSLSGTIPDLSALTSLRYLLLDGNSLSGTIPDLRNTNVRVLQLNNNNISGEIPTWLNDMDLRELYLHDNQLSGTIPDLSDVDDYDLDLSNNNLSGTIPAATHFPEEMRNFQGRLPAGKLNLSNNNLSGAIPDLSSLNNLYAIDLSNNSLNGSITAVLFPVGLNILDLSDNELSGAIPDLSTRMTKLTYLYLQNNQFSGTIPDLSSVGRQVWLNGNSISGTINADDFDNGVSYLYLHKNQLSNSTTIDLSSLSNLSEISLWGNPGLDLTMITGLDLSLEKAALWILYDSAGGSGWTNSSGWPVGSNFSQGYGITTDSSGNVTGIDLSENNLSGKINGGIAVLDSLEGLDLSCNSSLSGELPLGLKDIEPLATVNICSTGITVPGDQSFTTWKDGIIFTEGACSGAQACQAPVSNQGSSPPVSQSPDEGVGAGQGEGEPEDVQSPVPDPELPAADPGNIEAGGGCALVSGTGEERPGAAASGLLLAAFVLLPAFTGRHGRRAEER